MRIAIFTDTFYPEINGVSVALDNVISNLNKRHRFLVFAPKYPKMERERNYKNVNIYRQFSFPLPSYHFVRLTVPNILKSQKEFTKFKPDIVHIHGPGPLGLLGVYLAKRYKIPLVGTYHGILADFLTYVSLYRLTKFDLFTERLRNNFPRFFQLIGKRKPSPDNKAKEKLPQRIIWQLLNVFYNNCDLVLAPSKAIVTELKNRGIKTDVRAISNGINLKQFKPKKSYSEKPRKLIHVGRLGYEKNIDVIIHSMPKIIKHYPDVTLDIFGDGPARINLENLTKELKLTRFVKFHGFFPYERLNSAYLAHDVFITASTIETQGLVILEAMASGLPIIGVRKYAIPDLVINGKNGYVVAPFNIKQMANAIIKLLNNPKLCSKMGMNGVLFARKHELHYVLKKLENEYNKISR